MIVPSDHIQLRLSTKTQVIEDVEVVSKRTLMAARALEGKPVNDTLSLLPLLFSLCGTAQYQSGLMAIENALGIEPCKNEKHLRSILLDAESIAEHITRIMMDWASHAYVDTKMNRIRECRKKLGEFKSLLYEKGSFSVFDAAQIKARKNMLHRHCIDLIDVCEQDIFGCPLDQFYDMRSPDDLESWYKGNTAVAAACLKIWDHNGFFDQVWPKPAILPKLPEIFLEHRLDDKEADNFIAQPEYDRTGYETGPLGRHMDHPLILSLKSTAFSRLMAKLVDLSKLLLDLPNKINSIEEDTHRTMVDPTLKGLGQVEAVRGFLSHRIWLDEAGENIERYRILAPTEWNFHPEGPLKEALIGTKFTDNRKLMEQARLFVLALDPCVACDIQLDDQD